MAKLDKTQYSKEEAARLMEIRRLEKVSREKKEQYSKRVVPINFVEEEIVDESRFAHNQNVSFVLGNGMSRATIEPEELKKYGPIYGCNALYRTFKPDYLIAVDVKMVLEINKSGYQHKNIVWTNPNKTYQKMSNLNYFQPSKGWSSGPTALWLASQHNYEKIFILGFDYKGLDSGNRLNNIYADTVNYKKSTDGATFFGNWLRQTASVIKEHPKIMYYRVISPDNYCPEELNRFSNVKDIYIEDFKKMFNIS